MYVTTTTTSHRSFAIYAASLQFHFVYIFRLSSFHSDHFSYVFILIIIRMYHSHGTGSLSFALFSLIRWIHSGFTVHATWYWMCRFFSSIDLSAFSHTIAKRFNSFLFVSPSLSVFVLVLLLLLSCDIFFVITILCFATLFHRMLSMFVFFGRKYVWCVWLFSYAN